MTYLEIVNKVLIRLRENEVTSVQDSPYSKLIGEFVNIVKREVEDTYNWAVLRNTITIPTVASTITYTLTGSGVRSRVEHVANTSTGSKYELTYAPAASIETWNLVENPQTGKPYYFNLKGVSANGDGIVTLYPIPDAVYTIEYELFTPQVDLVNDSDTLSIPYQVVVEGALARAISERGDDGGYTEQEGRYNRILSDYIAIDAGNHYETTVWYVQ